MTSTALASGFSSMAFSTCATLMPSAMPSLSFTSGLTYTGTASQSISEFIALRCTFRGSIILSPLLQAYIIMLCTAEVVPPTMKKACAAPKASAAVSSASRMTDTGWQRLSSGFIEFTSASMHFCPKNSQSSAFPLPRLCPGTSKGTTRIRLNFCSAS